MRLPKRAVREGRERCTVYQERKCNLSLVRGCHYLSAVKRPVDMPLGGCSWFLGAGPPRAVQVATHQVYEDIGSSNAWSFGSPPTKTSTTKAPAELSLVSLCRLPGTRCMRTSGPAMPGSASGSTKVSPDFSRSQAPKAAFPGNEPRVVVQVATHQVYEYTGASNAWVAKAPMTTSRFRFNAAFASEAVYAFGGASTSICTSPGACLHLTSPCCRIFSLQTSTAKQAPTSPLSPIPSYLWGPMPLTRSDREPKVSLAGKSHLHRPTPVCASLCDHAAPVQLGWAGVGACRLRLAPLRLGSSICLGGCVCLYGASMSYAPPQTFGLS